MTDWPVLAAVFSGASVGLQLVIPLLGRVLRSRRERARLRTACGEIETIVGEALQSLELARSALAQGAMETGRRAEIEYQILQASRAGTRLLAIAQRLSFPIGASVALLELANCFRDPISLGRTAPATIKRLDALRLDARSRRDRFFAKARYAPPTRAR